MLFTLSIERLPEALEQATGVGRNTEQVGRLLKSVVVHPGHEDGIAPLRGDLDRLAVVVHLLDQREEVLPRLASGYRHGPLLSDWYVIWYQWQRLAGLGGARPSLANPAWTPRTCENPRPEALEVRCLLPRQLDAEAGLSLMREYIVLGRESGFALDRKALVIANNRGALLAPQ